MSKNYIIGVDIGGTNIRIGALDDSMALTEFTKIERRNVLFGDHVAEKLLNFLRDYIHRNFENEKIIAVTIGFPSTMNKGRTQLLSTPNIEGLDYIEIASMLPMGLGKPVYIERDVSMLFYYDKYRYHLPDTGIAIACYIGTGIGNVISIDGKLLSGADGVAGELGHIPMLGKEEICNCGNAGCAENYCSGRYLEKITKQYFPNVFIKDIFRKKAEEPVIQKFIENISIPIASEINILNPNQVILGGGVLAMDSFPKGLLETYILKHTRKPLPEQNLHFLYSADSDVNGVIGAAIYAKSKLDAEEIKNDSLGK